MPNMVPQLYAPALDKVTASYSHARDLADLANVKTLDHEEAALRLEELRRLVEHHRFLYYVLDRPEITDAEFDRLFSELEQIEGRFPDLITPNSPTQKVGAAPSTEFKQIKHDIPMLSLSNAMSEKEIDRWVERINRLLDLDELRAAELEYVCELKIDGLSVALKYRNGELICGATRGSGDVGE